MQRGEHQTQFANDKVDKSSDADEQQPRGTSELHGRNALASAILLLTTRQINALIRASFAERLSAFRKLQSHDKHRARPGCNGPVTVRFRRVPSGPQLKSACVSRTYGYFDSLPTSGGNSA